MDNIITRKYTLIPIEADTKEYQKRLYNFTLKDLEEKITYYKNKVKKEKDKDKKDDIKKKIENFEKSLDDIKNGGTFTKQMINNYSYGLVRSAMQSEAIRKNYIVSYMRQELMLNHVNEYEKLSDKIKFVKDRINYGYRKKGSKKGSLFDDTDIENVLGSYGVSFNQQLTSKITDAIKKGWLEGKSREPYYKLDSPFTIAKAHMSFSHDYDSFEELCEYVDQPDCNMYFNFGSNGIPTFAKFKICLGSRGNRNELKHTLLKVYSGEYEYLGSSIGISKNKIILNLSMKIPEVEMELNDDIVVGVDLGLAVPAMCALNNDLYKREAIGSKDDFLKVRTSLRDHRKRLQKSLKNASGGHGRKKKLKALEGLEKASKKESHFAETYCHMVSKKVVDFALKNHAAHINLENLNGYNTSKFILSNWSYYKLQNYIKYKAEKYGIQVHKVNPCYTSQVCSVCGGWEPKQRTSQAVFECKNPECKCHDKYKYGFNADFNAARNIAMSTLYMEKGEFSNKRKEEARKYYGFDEKYKTLHSDKENNDGE